MEPRERDAGRARRHAAAFAAPKPHRTPAARAAFWATLSGLVLCGGGYLTRPTVAGSGRGYQSSSA
jgi:hypothetical protein